MQRWSVSRGGGEVGGGTHGVSVSSMWVCFYGGLCDSKPQTNQGSAASGHRDKQREVREAAVSEMACICPAFGIMGTSMCSYLSTGKGV